MFSTIKTNDTDQAKRARHTKSQRSLGLRAHCHSNMPCPFITLWLALAHSSSYVFILIKKKLVSEHKLLSSPICKCKTKLRDNSHGGILQFNTIFINSKFHRLFTRLHRHLDGGKGRRREGETLSHTRNK